ncbi:hypothetical protein [Nitrosopumilus adriaticus]|uniref:Uncharacterized protein n=1 Tax=Nitrosopumilus adriaticus TaxID=1580092 RepID=A0A0D5C0N4_9ARCH|nr:hypothetical protein [Nitrosopumilus adriaticus]AJW70339.1 exported protein of unknown function [Nitrosopumilus adriaticus]
MKTRYKIPIIVGIVILIGFVAIVIAPVFLMIVSNALAGFIMSNTSDETFEEDFAKIPEVKFFIEKYPNHSTSHSGDFLGWKVIFYDSKAGNESAISLHVKKSVLHQGVKISAGCNNSNSSFAYDIPQEQVMDYLKNDKCLKK